MEINLLEDNEFEPHRLKLWQGRTTIFLLSWHDLVQFLWYVLGTWVTNLELINPSYFINAFSFVRFVVAI
jgi:hypothetical protein